MLVLLMLVVHLSGCVWLPVTGEDSFSERWTNDYWDTLLGSDIEIIKKKLASVSWKQLNEADQKHLYFQSNREFGFVIFGAPYGQAGGGFIGDQTVCYRLSFDETGRLYQSDRKTSSDLVSVIGSDGIVDCRKVLWTAGELAEIRKSLMANAAKGDRDAALILAEEYGDTAPLGMLAVATNDIALARVLVVEYSDIWALTKLASADLGADKEIKSSIGFRQSPQTRLGGLSAQEIEALARKGDSEAQFYLYYFRSSSTPFFWLCRAADQGHPAALFRLGGLYRSENFELEKNLPLSFKWYRLSRDRGVTAAEDMLYSTKKAMTRGQLAIAEQMYAEWLPGQCKMEIERNRIRD